ncbi:PKD domain-containing protein [Candidatus Bipolaricaulota bacterium]|nr:PKD domain-containing protein [Candidatus Bipolaricaulota bacterium]
MKKTILALLLLAPLFLTGCSLNDIMSGLVNQVPEAVIDASPLQGHAPLMVKFDASYSHDDGTIASYHWDFGDSHDTVPLSSIEATHTYTLPGTYLVKLTVTDDKGEMDYEKMAIIVKNPPPVASFEVSHDLPPVGEAVMFDASESYDSNGEIIGYVWEFGDGNTGSGVETSHAYMENGDYSVTLTVTDDAGAIGTAHHAISVQENSGGCPGGSCGDYGDLPLAVITGLPSCQGGRVGVPIELDGSFSRAAEGTIIRHAWDFGDDESAVGVRVSHAYQRTGRFTVTLTVTDDEGRRSSAWGYVSIIK